MFRKSNTKTISGSPSWQPNNLSSGDTTDTVAYVRFSEVVITTITGATRKIPVSSRCHIFQASFVNIQGTTFLALASSLGIQIWSTDGAEMKFFFAMSTLVDGEEDGHYMRGIADICKGFVCVGCSTGCILVLATPSATGDRITLAHNLEAAKTPITALAASEDILVAASDLGELTVFNVLSGFDIKGKFPGNQYPCTSLITREDSIAAAYSTGHIRIFQLSSMVMVYEVCAHARCVMGLALHASDNIMASVGEDQVVNVFTFPTFTSRASMDLELVFSDKIESRVLTGVAFINDDTLGVVAFDEDELNIFKKG